MPEAKAQGIPDHTVGVIDISPFFFERIAMIWISAYITKAGLGSEAG